MEFFIKGHSFLYEVQTMIQIFYPNEKFIQKDCISENCISVVLENNQITAEIYWEKIAEDTYSLYDDGDTANNIKICLYKLLSHYTNNYSKWGILTGVRPSKIAGKLLGEGKSENEIIVFMNEKYLVDPEKARLCIDVYKQEENIIKNNNGEDYSLYIGIPFCPERCLYCSFSSYPIEKYQHLIYNYINALEKEIFVVKKYFGRKRLENLYIGGGTPTSFSAEQLDFLLSILTKNFDLRNLKEFTVEAGRPDTINQEKLKVLKNYNVSRISINTQTTNDETLEKIGRKHSVADFYRAFEMAREFGFNNINVDLIIGLPGENQAVVENTINSVLNLKPESVTIHTLAVKRASKLKEDLDKYNFNISNIEEMLKIARDKILESGMHPYYMYRQKNIMGNFENVGYALSGYECFYNVQIMEEKQSVIALGAGATSKIVNLKTDRIERIFNVKNIDEYLKRIDEMCERKETILKEWFCENNCPERNK